MSKKRSLSRSHRTPLWQAILLPVAAVLIFFLLLEGGLALFGVQPALKMEDPFVGFSSNSPLFASQTGPDGRELLITNSNKKDYFNIQRFPAEKDPGTFRIFTLGGSTTYGRPYDDSTSFSGWLRELLPAVDAGKQWEVINAGGISYASYRVAKLMEELVQYQPDLFVIYTGHNEFLEERTYHQIKEMSPLLKSAAAVLQNTRTWTAMSKVLAGLDSGSGAGQEDGERYKLSGEVDAILDGSVGLDAYKRDDALQANVVKHFRISLEKMVELARSAGARVLFVTPASNLRDCSPFKSQDTKGIDAAAAKRSFELMTMSKPMAWQKNWEIGLNFLDQAIGLNPDYAELRYRRGEALFELGRYPEAKKEFIIARDEDICPLRALSPLVATVNIVAKMQKTMLVDFETLLEDRLMSRQHHSIPGDDYFLDHVHPTIEGHKLLAIAMVEAMAEQGLVNPAKDWQQGALGAVSAKIEGGVNPQKQGKALANLARVLLWAGKNDDAARLSRQALEVAGGFQQVADNAAASLATAYVRIGQPGVAVQQLYHYLESWPNSVELRLKLGQILMDPQLRNREEAAANLLVVSQLVPYYDWVHALYGINMADRGRPGIAYPSLIEALRLNPNNSSASQKLAQIRPMLQDQQVPSQVLQVQMERYASGAPKKLIQGQLDSAGRFTPHGIEVEFYENGRLKRFLDVKMGQPLGAEKWWDEQGKPILPE